MSDADTRTEVFVWSSEDVCLWIPHSEGNTGQFKTQIVCVSVCISVCKLICLYSQLEQSKALQGSRRQQQPSKVLSKGPDRSVQSWEQPDNQVLSNSRVQCCGRWAKSNHPRIC